MKHWLRPKRERRLSHDLPQLSMKMLYKTQKGRHCPRRRLVHLTTMTPKMISPARKARSRRLAPTSWGTGWPLLFLNLMNNIFCTVTMMGGFQNGVLLHIVNDAYCLCYWNLVPIQSDILVSFVYACLCYLNCTWYVELVSIF